MSVRKEGMLRTTSGGYMVRSGTYLAFLVAAIAVGGCSKQDIRLFKLYTFQLDEAQKKAPKKRVAATPSNDNEAEKNAVATAATAQGASAIETGSTSDACQGEHIAYQATKEYLKNFGPKPQDEPGEVGPCKASIPPAEAGPKQ